MPVTVGAHSIPFNTGREKLNNGFSLLLLAAYLHSRGGADFSFFSLFSSKRK